MARKEIAADGDSPLERAPWDAEVGPGTVGGAAGLRAENRRLRLELVTNSLVHGALGDEDGIVVRMQLHAESLRLEVHNRGTAGTIAANGGDPVRGRGFGLDLVRMLSNRWGVRRGEDTFVWVEMARA